MPDLSLERMKVMKKGKGLGKFSSKAKKTPEESDIEIIEKICSTILKIAAPTHSPASPRSTELDNFARDIVSSIRRVQEERWNDVKMEIMMVIRNFSSALPP
ncbi:uncharacterized protein LOC121389507 [Gigantopelta aegis]|uniref:uncharacterized protein LOC121389507 n=1 Tax=Gigantopelta aegis TaxID=1735272 RepID=UPI001B889449|nr:uncharacterized protein LOC121389507 [Gigantopelta aegis]